MPVAVQGGPVRSLSFPPMGMPFLRARRRAFWELAGSHLVVAVVERRGDEAQLEACAMVRAAQSPPSALFAPGLLDASYAVGACRLSHIAALEGRHCRLYPSRPPATLPDDSERKFLRVAVRGSRGGTLEADRGAVSAAAGLFSRAGLRLAAIDGAPCAAMNLRAFLGGSGANELVDPLAAVSVAAECEQSANQLATELAVPIGLALAHLGLLEDDAG